MVRITLSLVLIIGFIFAASFACAEPIKATHAVELKDPEGDVRNLSDPGKDVVNVSIKSDGKQLHVAITLQEEIAHYLEGHKAGAVVEIHFDTDNNPATGGEIFWTKNTGFEYVVSIRTCIKYENGEACVGGLGAPSTGFFSSYATKKYEQGSSSANDIHEFMWKSPRKDIMGNIVTTKIPYAEIGVASGQTIRMVVEEKDSNDPKKAYSPDIIFTLK